MPAIDIDGLKVNYTDRGSGVCIVFVPGLAGTKEWFNYQVSGLSDRYRIVSYDLRRARGRAARSSYTLDQLVDDLDRLLSALHIHEAAIAGHSLGGLIALQFALAHPDRCSLLILSSTAPCYSNVSEAELASYYIPGGFQREGLLGALRRLLFGHKPGLEDESDPLALLRQSVRDLDAGTLAVRLKLLREVDMTPVLGEIVVPTLVVAGSLEMPQILAGAQTLEQNMSRSSLEIIEGADQFHFYTSHDRFNAIVADFVARNIRP